MNHVKNLIKGDKLIWQSIVTIDKNENYTFKSRPEYSSHIVHLYEKPNKEKYYLFIQLDVFDNGYYLNKIGWMETDDKLYFNSSGWGSYIMNYNYEQYNSLKRQIKIDDDTKIYGVLECQLGDDISECEYVYIPTSYRFKDIYDK